MAKTNTSPATLNPAEGSDYLVWLEQVPLKERKRIARLQGTITPVIARELRYWAELLFTVIATENSAAGTPENAQQDIITSLLMVQQSVKTQPLMVPERERVVLMAEGE